MIRHEQDNSQSGYFYRSRIRNNEKLPFSCNSHFHSCFELLYVIEGSFLLTVNGETARMKPGDLSLIFPFSVHSFEFDMTKPFSFWIVTYTANFVNSFLKETEGRIGTNAPFTLDEPTRSFAKRILFTDAVEHSEDLLLTKSALYAVSSAYLSKVPLKKRTAPDRMSLAEKVMDYVSNHYAENMTLGSIARALGYSYSYLSHGFSKLFSLSFSTYLNLYRIDRAEYLLLNTGLPVTEIAEKTGFSSIRNFNFVFRNVYGTSPREYRKYRKTTAAD